MRGGVDAWGWSVPTVPSPLPSLPLPPRKPAGPLSQAAGGPNHARAGKEGRKKNREKQQGLQVTHESRWARALPPVQRAGPGLVSLLFGRVRFFFFVFFRFGSSRASWCLCYCSSAFLGGKLPLQRVCGLAVATIAAAAGRSGAQSRADWLLLAPPRSFKTFASTLAPRNARPGAVGRPLGL
jgi:hypothetical protein